MLTTGHGVEKLFYVFSGSVSVYLASIYHGTKLAVQFCLPCGLSFMGTRKSYYRYSNIPTTPFLSLSQASNPPALTHQDPVPHS